MAELPDWLVAVEPIGTRDVDGFWDGHDEHGNFVGGYGSFKMPRYPESPGGEAFRLRRVELGLRLSDASARLGITAEQVSGLQFGKYAPRDGDWAALMKRLEDPND